MTRCSAIRAALVLSACVSVAAGAPSDDVGVERAFGRFFGAPTREAAARLVNEVVGSGVAFDDAYARLKRGRSYLGSVPRGVRRLKREASDGVPHHYAIVVPDTYTPSRSYQLRVQLHGGIARPAAQPGREGLDRIPGGADQIYVHPNGWEKAMWWFANQVDNIGGILDELKRAYNVDENRVYLTGISDGGTGAYFFAFRDTTPWASFLPLNGHMVVLANPETGADGDLHPGNAVNKPFFIVNGGQDRLYPAARVEPYVEHLRRIGTTVVYHPQPQAGHNTDWWPEEKESFERFLREHPRDPLPDRLSWETDRTDRYNRAHWMLIDELGSVGGEAKLADTNLLDRSPLPVEDLFPRRRKSGRVDLVRQANTINASTMGVRAFTLLLSPDEFNFQAPIKVITNQNVAFEGKVAKSVATLMKWAARDNDRTMLFGAELRVVVK